MAAVLKMGDRSGPDRLDQIDRRILAALQRDATAPVAQIAGRVGLSQTPCWKRIQKLEAAGVITGRVALVDPARVGLGLTVFVSIEAPEHAPAWRAAFAAALERMPQVLEVYRLAGEVDYLLKVVAADTDDFDAFYRTLTETVPLRAVTARFAMERLKSTTVLPVEPAPDAPRRASRRSGS